MPTATRTLGTMLRFVRDRGFAFVSDGNGHDVFVHRTGVEPPSLYDSLQDGDVVSFQMQTTAKGPRAFDLRLATPAEAQQVAAREQDNRTRI
jgi:CspA family cold shock protein